MPEPLPQGIRVMARLPKDVIVTSQPIRIFPNGDSFYIQLSRASGYYDCTAKMARSGDPASSVTVALARARTIREAESRCYERLLGRCPWFPRPPYLQRGSGAVRTLVKH